MRKHYHRGENHPKANLDDYEVELLRTMRESGIAWRKLATIFETPVRTIRSICNYDRR